MCLDKQQIYKKRDSTDLENCRLITLLFMLFLCRTLKSSSVFSLLFSQSTSGGFSTYTSNVNNYFRLKLQRRTLRNTIQREMNFSKTKEVLERFGLMICVHTSHQWIAIHNLGNPAVDDFS